MCTVDNHFTAEKVQGYFGTWTGRDYMKKAIFAQIHLSHGMMPYIQYEKMN